MPTLPDLGRRGEGCVAIQFALLLPLALAGVLGPAWDGPLRMVTSLIGSAALVVGAILAILGARDLGTSLTPLPHPTDDATLVEHGVYGLVRHPIYGGIIAGSLGWGLLTASPTALGLAVVLLVFFGLKSAREEAWLSQRFPGYPAYRARTRRFIPWIG
jgi:protein-S-isoprenylcysteine O-methyltransferase Ste14